MKSHVQVDFYGNGEKRYIEYLKEIVEKNDLKKVTINNYDPDIYRKLSNYDFPQ